MTHIAVAGTRDGRLVRIDWTDGVFSGDPQLVALAQSLAKAYDGKAFGPGFSPATYTTAEHIASPTSAYQLMQLCFLDQRPETFGEVPGLVYDDVLTSADVDPSLLPSPSAPESPDSPGQIVAPDATTDEPPAE